MIKEMHFPKLSLKVIGAVILIALVGGGIWWFNTGSQTTVLKDATGDLAKKAGGEKAAIDFIDLKSLSIKVDGQNLVLRYQLKDPLPKDASILQEVDGAKIATLQIWATLQNEKTLGKIAMLVNRWGTSGRVFSGNFEYNTNVAPDSGPSNQIPKKAKLISGGLGNDYFEVAYPLADLNLARGDQVRMRVFATVLNSNGQFISEDIIADENFAIEGDLVKEALMTVKLGSSSPPPH